MSTERNWPLWFALGTAGAGLLASSKRKGTLRSPLDSDRVVQLTPHGYFGADREGPPAHEHQGVDIAARVGAPILAVGDGLIVRASPGLGKVVRKLQLDEPGFWPGSSGALVDSVVYADLGDPVVEPGDTVSKGDIIAFVGPRGFFHFAVRGFREGFFDPARAGFAYVIPGQKGGFPWAT